MGNTYSGRSSNDIYSAPKVDFSGVDNVTPALDSANKEKKDAKAEKVKSKIKPKSKTTNSKGGIAKCPLQSKPTKVTPKAKKNPTKAEPFNKCNLSVLSVDKEGRKFLLDVNAVQLACTLGKLEIVSGYNRRRKLITCNVKGLSACNATHLKKVVDFTDAYDSKSDSVLKFKASSAYGFSFFPWKPKTNRYNVIANTCNAIVGAEVIVYPDTYWKVEVFTDLKEKKIDNITVKGSFKEDDNNLSFSISTKKATADFSYSNDDITVGGGFTNSEKKKGGYYSYKDKDMEQSASAYNDGEATAKYKDKNVEYDTKFSKDESKVYYKDSETIFDASTKEGESKVAYKDKDKSFVSYANTTDTGTHYKDSDTEYHNHYSAEKLVKDTVKDEVTLAPTDRDRQLKGQIQTKLVTYIETLQKTISIIQFVETIVSTLTETLQSPVSFDINWPKISLSGEWYWKEIEASPKCGFEVVIKGDFTPLIGCHCDIDIVGAALSAIPYVGGIIARLVKLYKKLTHNDFKINISISNDLNFNFDITKKASSEKFEFSSPPALNKFALKLTAEVKSQKGNLILAGAGYLGANVSEHGGGMEGSSSINIYLHTPVQTVYGFDIPCDFEFTGISIVTYKFVKATSEFSDVLPDDENFKMNKADKETVLKNWLASEKKPFAIPILAY